MKKLLKADIFEVNINLKKTLPRTSYLACYSVSCNNSSSASWRFFVCHISNVMMGYVLLFMTATAEVYIISCK